MNRFYTNELLRAELWALIHTTGNSESGRLAVLGRRNAFWSVTRALESGCWPWHHETQLLLSSSWPHLHFHYYPLRVLLAPGPDSHCLSPALPHGSGKAKSELWWAGARPFQHTSDATESSQLRNPPPIRDRKLQFSSMALARANHSVLSGIITTLSQRTAVTRAAPGAEERPSAVTLRGGTERQPAVPCWRPGPPHTTRQPSEGIVYISIAHLSGKLDVTVTQCATALPHRSQRLQRAGEGCCFRFDSQRNHSTAEESRSRHLLPRRYPPARRQAPLLPGQPPGTGTIRALW